MRAASFIVLASACATYGGAASAQPAPRPLFWSAGDSPVEAAARTGYGDALSAAVVDLPRDGEAPAPVSLVAALDEARAEYKRFAFAAAKAHLDALLAKAEPAGGSDLDATQLSDLYLYRWLCRGELGRSDGSWDDLVQAARLAPTRVLDAAQVAPRALAAWRRALGEIAGQKRAHLVVDAPPDARLRIDGVDTPLTGEVTTGRHFVRLWAPGYEVWSGVIDAVPPTTRAAPPLRPVRAPDIETLPRRADERLVLGSLERRANGWRFRVSLVEGKEGKLVSEAIELEESGVRGAVVALTRRVVTPPAIAITAAAIAAPLPPRPVERKKLWIGLGVGGCILAVGAIAIALGVVYGRTTPAGTITTAGLP